MEMALEQMVRVVNVRDLQSDMPVHVQERFLPAKPVLDLERGRPPATRHPPRGRAWQRTFRGFGQAQTLSYIENAFLFGIPEENAFLWGFWEVILPQMRFGRAQTLSYIENVFLFVNSEENAFLLGFWEVILPQMSFRQAQTLSYIENAFLLEILKKMVSFWAGLGRHAGRECWPI